MTDFESALKHSLQFVFPNAALQRCPFHFSQAIYQRAHKVVFLSLSKNENLQLTITKLFYICVSPIGLLS